MVGSWGIGKVMDLWEIVVLVFSFLVLIGWVDGYLW